MFFVIQQKLKTDEYKSLPAFLGDVQLLVENAKKFYPVCVCVCVCVCLSVCRCVMASLSLSLSLSLALSHLLMSTRELFS